MNEQERREFKKNFTLQDYAIQQQENLYREQARKEKESNIPIEIRPYWILGVMAINFMTVPLEVLLRRHFGSRYLSVGRIILALIFYGIMIAMGAYINGYTEETTIAEGWLGRLYTTEHHSDVPFMMIAFAFLWIPAAIYNVWVIKQRQRRRIRWHTRSTGISYLQGRLPGSDWTHYRFWEPCLWLAVGIAFLKISYPFGLYLTIAAVLLLIRNNQTYAEHNTDRLNRGDAEIEAEVIAGGVREGGKATNFGFDPISMPEDMNAKIGDIERDLVARLPRQRSGNVSARDPREWESVGEIVTSVTSQQPVTGATAPATAQPATPPTQPPAPVWHQAEDWPEYDVADTSQSGSPAYGVTPV